MVGFIDTALVYTPATADGDYTVLAATLTHARLCITNKNVTIGTGRVELRMEPLLMWSDDYEMPNDAQIQVDDTRYNVKAGTYDALRGPSGAVMYHRVDVVELDGAVIAAQRAALEDGTGNWLFKDGTVITYG